MFQIMEMSLRHLIKPTRVTDVLLRTPHPNTQGPKRWTWEGMLRAPTLWVVYQRGVNYTAILKP